MVLAICGGGNGGHALAVVASQNFGGEITWLVRTEEKAAFLRRRLTGEGLHSTGVITGHANNVRTISSDPAEVVSRADIVIIVVPAFAHAPILEQIHPYLKETALVGSIPTRSGFEFEASRFITGVEPHGHRRIFGLQTLPWSTRVQQVGKIVNFSALKAQVLMAAMPADYAPGIAQQLSQIIGTEIVPTGNMLNMTLGNVGQIIHPGLMYGHFASWNGRPYSEETIPRFYADAGDEIGACVERLSSEIVEIAYEIEAKSRGSIDLSGVPTIHQWLCQSYPTQTADMSTVAKCFRTGPLQHRKAPMLEVSSGNFVPNYRYRYLSEDVPYGLCVSKAIAQIAQVHTPTIDAVIRWTQHTMGKVYMVDRKLDGPDAAMLPIPQNYGITTLPELLGWYRQPNALKPLASIALS